MIVLPWFFLILVLLPASRSQTVPTKSSRKSKIDWEQCGLFAKCFCVESTDQYKLKEQFEAIKAPESTDPEDVEGLCNIGVQIKYFDVESAVFQLQVIGAQYEINQNPELILYKGTQKLFGCKLNSKSKIEVVVDAAIAQFEISPFEKRSYFNPNNVLCAVTVKNAVELTNWIKEDELNVGSTKMKFINTDYNYQPGEAFYASQGKEKCDPYSFKDYDGISKEYHVKPIVDRDRGKLNCAHYSKSYTMRYDGPGKQGEKMIRLQCVLKGKKYIYIIVHTDEFIQKTTTTIDPEKVIPDKDVTNPASYTFYCAANVDETCDDPHKDCTPAAGKPCPIFTPGSPGIPAKLGCVGNKWLIEDQYLELTKEPFCTRDKTSTSKNAVAFYFKLPSGKSVPQPKARCFTEYNCTAKSKLSLPNCEGADKNLCGEVDNTNGMLKCKDETKHMTVFKSEDPSFSWNHSSYICNPATGMYFNETDILPARARVRCIGKPIVPKEEAAEFSDNQVVGYIGAAFAGVLVIIGVTFVTICFSLKSAKKVRKKQKKTWVKMKRADQISKCKEDFAKILAATVDNSKAILAGLDQVELLLEAETEEAECWEESYKFLKRLQGAIFHIDNGVSLLFSRYLYLQAKKIIDKHGWLTTERITKKNQRGLMRAVAIRLVNFAMNDPKCTEAHDLIGEGYDLLGFDAVEQYPHCGLMWSLIMHRRSEYFKNKAGEDKELRRFLCVKALETLMNIAGGSIYKLPEDEVIPVFGTIEEQAAYAMGSAPILSFHMEHSEKVLMELNSSHERAVARSYFRGMGEALPLISLQTVMQAFAIDKPEWDPKSDLLKRFWQLMPSAVWNELVFDAEQTLVHYGLSIDAKILHRCITQSNPEAELDDITIEQQQFAEAAEKIKEDLRDWFAARTDKEELKKKPDYILNPNLITRVTGEASAPNVEPKSKDAPAAAATRSGNKSAAATPNSAGSTNSDQTPKQTPTEPKDAAAPPAAPAAAAAEAPAKPAA